MSSILNSLEANDAYRADVYDVCDPRWAAFERALDQGGRPLALQSRLAWAQMSAHRRALLIAVHNEAGEAVFGLAILGSTSRIFPAYEIWRMERVGLDVPVDASKCAIRKAIELARRTHRVLRVELMVVTPDSTARAEIGAAALAVGFRARTQLHQVYRRTILLDVTSGDPEALIAALPANTRRKVRLASRRGLDVRPIESPTYGQRLTSLMEETMARTGGTAQVIDWATVINISQKHPNRSRLIGAFVPGAPFPADLLAFAWGCHHGTYAHYDAGGSTRHTNVNAPLAYALLWDLVIWAKANGAKYFDFAGVTERRAGEDDPLAGISDFKRHFSRCELEVGEEWVYSPSAWRAKTADILSGVAHRIGSLTGTRPTASSKEAIVSREFLLRRSSLRRVAGLVRQVTAFLIGFDEYRIYRMPAARAKMLIGGENLARDDIDHLRLYEPDAPWHLPRDAQSKRIQERLAAGSHVYTVAENGGLIHYAWMVAPAERIDTDFGLPPFILPANSAVLWDDHTYRSARARGLQTASIKRRALDAANVPDVQSIFIGVSARNQISRHNIEKVGFLLFARLQKFRFLGVSFSRTIYMSEVKLV